MALTEEQKEKWLELITELTVTIGKQLKMTKNNQLLIMMSMNTPKMIHEFSGWIRRHTENNKIMLTENQVMKATWAIAHGEAPTE